MTNERLVRNAALPPEAEVARIAAVLGDALMDKRLWKVEPDGRIAIDTANLASATYDAGLRSAQAPESPEPTEVAPSIDVERLARALTNIALRDDPLGPDEVIVSIALEPNDPDLLAADIAAEYATLARTREPAGEGERQAETTEHVHPDGQRVWHQHGGWHRHEAEPAEVAPCSCDWTRDTCPRHPTPADRLSEGREP